MKVRVGTLLGLAVVLLAPPAVVSLDRVSEQVLSAARGVDPAGVPRAGDRPATDATANGSQNLSPTDPGPTSDKADNGVRNLMVAALDRQVAAVRAGDLNGFLDVADPAATTLRADLTARFASLQAMKVAGWSQSVAGKPLAGPGGTWSAQVQIRYCFVVSGCTQVPITVASRWVVGGGQAKLTELGTAPPEQVGPRPWEVSELQALVGNRVIVAGTKRWATRFKGVLASAERAAAVTDRYAKWNPVPGRYVVYVAGPDEWAKWYGVQQASWVAAYAMPLTDTYTEIVLNANKVSTTDAKEVLQHEFTHVVTLAGVQRTYPGTWWLIEGIAEYVQNVGLPLVMYRALGDGRRYVKSGAWNGSVALGEPTAAATTSEANGRYAVAFLAVRRLAERFGEQRMLDFFNLVARTGKGLEAASATVFGQPWLQVSDDCSRYVRRSVGA